MPNPITYHSYTSPNTAAHVMALQHSEQQPQQVAVHMVLFLKSLRCSHYNSTNPSTSIPGQQGCTHHHHHQDHSCWTSLHRSQPQFQKPIGTDSVGEPYSNCNLQSCAHTNQCPHLPTPCLFQHSRDYRCTRRDPALLPPAVTPCHALCVWAAVAAPGPRPAAEPGTGPRTAAGSGTHWPGTAR